jgi:hypothetical protein
MLTVLNDFIDWFKLTPPLSPERREQVKSILRTELETHRVDGKPVTHRRLESLMLTAGTPRRQTIQLLREIGARPSKRRGAKFWTLKPKGAKG